MEVVFFLFSFYFVASHTCYLSFFINKVMRADDSVAFTIVKDQAYTLQMEIYEGSKRRRDEPVGSIAKLYATCPPYLLYHGLWLVDSCE
jgi:hypothetical protein